jgi:hypothetical protein
MKNKLPRPQTIARHYSEGKLCDYPAENVLSAVNSYDFNYNSVTIPIQPNFGVVFYSDIEAFIYLADHNSESEVATFLADPNEFMSAAGIELVVPIDKQSAAIMAILVEPPLPEILRHGNLGRLINHVTSTEWRQSHTQKFSKNFCTADAYSGLDDKFKSYRDFDPTKYGFCQDFICQMEYFTFSICEK